MLTFFGQTFHLWFKLIRIRIVSLIIKRKKKSNVSLTSDLVTRRLTLPSRRGSSMPTWPDGSTTFNTSPASSATCPPSLCSGTESTSADITDPPAPPSSSGSTSSNLVSAVLSFIVCFSITGSPSYTNNNNKILLSLVFLGNVPVFPVIPVITSLFMGLEVMKS